MKFRSYDKSVYYFCFEIYRNTHDPSHPFLGRGTLPPVGNNVTDDNHFTQRLVTIIVF